MKVSLLFMQRNHSIRASPDALEDTCLLENQLQLCNEDETLLELCSRAWRELRGALNPPLLSTLISPLGLISEGLDALPKDVERAEGGAVWGSGQGGFRCRRGRTGGSDVILDGEHQARAAAQQLLLAGVQLALQRLL